MRICVRKHLLKDKKYQIDIGEDKLSLREENKENPKYELELNLKRRILWKLKNNWISAFGLELGQNKVKWFYGNDMKELYD